VTGNGAEIANTKGKEEMARAKDDKSIGNDEEATENNDEEVKVAAQLETGQRCRRHYIHKVQIHHLRRREQVVRMAAALGDGIERSDEKRILVTNRTVPAGESE
jgi:hypothetical protein